MKRVLIIDRGRDADSQLPGLPLPPNDNVAVERLTLPEPDAPAPAWDALVAALLAADLIIAS